MDVAGTGDKGTLDTLTDIIIPFSRLYLHPRPSVRPSVRPVLILVGCLNVMDVFYGFLFVFLMVDIRVVCRCKIKIIFRF